MHLMIFFSLYFLFVVLLGSALYIYIIPLTILHFSFHFSSIGLPPFSSLSIIWYDQLVLSCPSTYG